jgi:hypothetical protein
MRGKLANIGRRAASAKKSIKEYNPMPQGRGMAMLMGRSFCRRRCWQLC